MASRHRLVAAVSAAQLFVGVAGQAIALRRRLPYDVGLVGMRGRPEHVARDSWLLGTALSAPVTMLGVQAVAAVRLAAGPSALATRVTGTLGAMMVGGYLAERVVRERLSVGAWDAVESPVAAAGLALAGAMVLAGLGRAGG
jgi:energy-converting hydrogenase Eha subunit A